MEVNVGLKRRPESLHKVDGSWVGVRLWPLTMASGLGRAEVVREYRVKKCARDGAT